VLIGLRETGQDGQFRFLAWLQDLPVAQIAQLVGRRSLRVATRRYSRVTTTTHPLYIMYYLLPAAVDALPLRTSHFGTPGTKNDATTQFELLSQLAAGVLA
jgi:hypothetical protein